MSRPITLITPYREPVKSVVESRFNRYHEKARSITGKAFHIMRSRCCSIFFKALEVLPVFAVKIIACCLKSVTKELLIC